jgi:hypothetical protein
MFIQVCENLPIPSKSLEGQASEHGNARSLCYFKKISYSINKICHYTLFMRTALKYFVKNKNLFNQVHGG